MNRPDVHEAIRIKMTLVLGAGYPETARALSDREDYDPVVILAASMGGPSITLSGWRSWVDRCHHIQSTIMHLRV